jgi:GntR family transcriptional regulator
MLKRSPSLTDQAKDHIKQRILADEYDGGRIPSETDLASELGVSRTTIRDALGRLEIEGVIFRKQGAGTFVNEPGLQIKSRLEEIWSYESILEDHGYTPSTRILNIYYEEAAQNIATDLNLAPKERVVIVEKLFLEDEEPVILTRNYIPEKLIIQPFHDADFQVPVFEFLTKYCEQHLSYYLSEIVPVAVSDSLGRILNLPAETALISFEEIGYSEDNEPVLKAYSYFRDDLLRLRLIRRRV